MNYHKIDICNMDNGSGLRVVLWVSGCNHCCKGCFNSQTWDPASGGKFDDEAFAAIDNALSQSWCSGITLSGGDPLFPQSRAAIRDLCLKIKENHPTKTIWLYTGYTFEELVAANDVIVRQILYLTDVLVDGLFVEKLKSPSKHWVGSSNQRVIDLPRTLKQKEIVLYDEN